MRAGIPQRRREWSSRRGRWNASGRSYRGCRERARRGQGLSCSRCAFYRNQSRQRLLPAHLGTRRILSGKPKGDRCALEVLRSLDWRSYGGPRWVCPFAWSGVAAQGVIGTFARGYDAREGAIRDREFLGFVGARHHTRSLRKCEWVERPGRSQWQWNVWGVCCP